MAKKQLSNPAEYIEPLYMNGLRGRMLRLKASPRKQKEILIVYGEHTSLERIFGLAEALNSYGGVTVPDLPGFGGMQSFYKLNEKPSTDNMADYLAAFIKLRYKNRRFSVVAVGYGFSILTRVLQRYPEIVKKVDLLVSLGGYVHHEDLHISKIDYYNLRLSSGLLSKQPMASLAKLFIRPALIRWTYQTFNSKSPKLSGVSAEEREQRIAFEIHLWRTNDLRTQMYCTSTALKLDLCNAQVDLPVYHVRLKQGRDINEDVAEQHLNVVYKKVHIYNSSLKIPNLSTAFFDTKDSNRLIPVSLKKLFNKA